LTIVDAQGKVVQATKTIQNNTSIDVANLESGVYFVRLTSNGASVLKRIVKN
jgi:hypothetical protein